MEMKHVANRDGRIDIFIGLASNWHNSKYTEFEKKNIKTNFLFTKKVSGRATERWMAMFKYVHTAQ